MSATNVQNKRKAMDLDVPRRGEDPGERKRVLNVLAQRRYRQKRKAHFQKLQAQVTQLGVETSESEAHSRCDRKTAQTAAAEIAEAPFGSHDFSEDYGDNVLVVAAEQCFWTSPVLLPSQPSTPLSETTLSRSNEDATWSLPSLDKSDRPCASPELTSYDIQYSFPDEAYLEMTELTLLRGCMSIARRMNVHELIWSLSATSPFADPAMAMAQFIHLPNNLQPTLVQMTIPHHPVIDLLPWPSARDRMIKILSQPPEVRPPSAASPMALLDFIYDIEDGAEGVRIVGSDPYSDRNWEIGEKVFRSWWWMFDRDIISQSNQLRALRGAPMLGTGSILGEE